MTTGLGARKSELGSWGKVLGIGLLQESGRTDCTRGEGCRWFCDRQQTAVTESCPVNHPKSLLCISKTDTCLGVKTVLLRATQRATASSSGVTLQGCIGGSS